MLLNSFFFNYSGNIPKVVATLVEDQVNNDDETPNFGDISAFVKEANLVMNKTEIAVLGIIPF